ncbi:MAG: ferrous iron transport protein B [Candidatus Schekmanbacteria bacterium GWA2_38_11]|uniref:Ferrous iron transport protein B n=1 Tax=Candidatus Schekmanbacteria bacterium GWA2_38_11 TaxID=1817876 RepID=A0A1F7RCD7_9BACT|nr:MAG: ferrous iron transport protein B [Candidatus Schekmanbacteria bacterium GWA2_38_11]
MHHQEAVKIDSKEVPTIILVGNPNVGKSVIFGLLTGKYVTVSNYPGTTVEVTEGVLQASLPKLGVNPTQVRLIDSPGVNSLMPRSEDERVTRDLLLTQNPTGIIQVADAKNLKRSLLITSQLGEMGFPLILVLNIYDEAQERGIDIDTKSLSKILGIKVIATVATEKRGIPELRGGFGDFKKAILNFTYSEPIENAVKQISRFVPELTISKRALSLMLLAEDEDLLEYLKRKKPDLALDIIRGIVARTKSYFREPVNFVIFKERQQKINEIFDKTVSVEGKKPKAWKEKVGNLCMHPVIGIPILLLVLLVMYEFVGVLGAGIAVNLFEKIIFGKYINPFAARILETVMPVKIIKELLVGEYGVITVGLTYSVAIVFPIVGFFFIFFGILEDSGYLPRLTVMSNKIFKKIGLHGRAVLPMVLGLGCDTMATLTTRILDTRRERIIATLLLALGIPCSAQLGVILGMLGSMSPKALIIVIVTVVLQLLIVGYLAAKVLPGKSSDFLSEIPPLRIPKLYNIIVKTYYRVKWFMKEAVPLFMLGTFILFLFNKLGLLEIIEQGIKPVVSGILGLPDKTAEAFLVGFLRRDYGAAGLFKLAGEGYLNLHQITVAISVMILFVPCLANFFVIIKEQGIKRATLMTVFIFAYAILIGGLLNLFLQYVPLV